MHPRSPVQDASRLLLAAIVASGCASPISSFREWYERQARVPARQAAPAAYEDQVPVPASWETYVVRPGDTLWRIAACRGISVEALASANGLVDPDQVPVQTQLRVPTGNRCEDATLAAARPPEPAAPARRAEPAAPARPARIAPAAPTRAAPIPEQVAALERARSAIAAGRASYDAADFDAAIVASREAQRALDSAPRDAASDSLRARSHLLAAMAEVGLEHRDRALEELRQAFALDPALELPPEDASPRIVELVVEARPNAAVTEAAP